MEHEVRAAPQAAARTSTLNRERMDLGDFMSLLGRLLAATGCLGRAKSHAVEQPGPAREGHPGQRQFQKWNNFESSESQHVEISCWDFLLPIFYGPLVTVRQTLSMIPALLLLASCDELTKSTSSGGGTS